MQQPRGHSIDDIAQTTQTYLDVYIALELLHCSYATYIQTVPQHERLLNQFYVMLKSAKEQHAQDEAERRAEEEREMDDMLGGRR